MEALEKQREESPLFQHLHDALGKAESGDYNEALSLLRPAKSLEPRNIYILAFEKQLEQLIEFKQRNILSDEQRSDIMDSLPGIVERALGGSAGIQGEAGSPAGDRQEAEETGRSGEERSAAFEWLKNQYFQHAHEHVRKGEYQNALGEIRRVYIIDPGNKVARDFERQIQVAAKLHSERLRVQEAAPPAPPAELPRPSAPPRPQATRAADGEDIPTKTEEWSSPVPPYPVNLRGPMAEPEHEKDSSTAIVIGILVTILVAIAAGYFFMGRQSSIRKEVKPPTGSFAAPPEQFYAAREEATEQAFVVSSSPSSGGARSLQVTSIAPSQKSTPGSRHGNRKRPETGTEEAGEPAKADQNIAASSVKTEPASGEQATPAGAQGAEIAHAPPAADVLEKNPEVLKLEKPRFPDNAYALGLVGQVVVQVQVGPDGRPMKSKILKSTNESLNDSVVDAVMKSTYVPGQAASGPVASWLTIPFRFETTR